MEEKKGNITIRVQDIPAGYDRDNNFGFIEKFTYGNRTGQILLPDNLDNKKKYPVLYLYHGLGGDSHEWTNHDGRVKQIVGNLILGRNMQETVVVMPDISYPYRSQNDKINDFHNFLNILTCELIPFIESRYPVSDKPMYRAIAGLSLGGMTVLYNACKLKSMFSSVGAFSPITFLLPVPQEHIPGWIRKEEDFTLGTDKKCFNFIGNGDCDKLTFHYPKHYSDVLKTNKVNNVFVSLQGGEHNWEAFRILLYLFLSYNFFPEAYIEIENEEG